MNTLSIIDFACFILVILVIIIALIKNFVDDRKKGKDIKKGIKLLQKENEKQEEGITTNNSLKNVFNEKSEGEKSCFFAPPSKTGFVEKHYKIIWLVFAIILFFTVIFKFGEIPAYIGVDEAGMAYDAYCLAEYGTDRYQNSYPLYLTNFGQGQSSLCAYLAALFIKLFGFNEVTYRLPALIVYLVSMVVSYLLVSKAKNKKVALLFTFLIITCPWNIFNARMALDCNLFAGLFMLDLYLLNRARKDVHFVIAGISIGLTLYTYALSWITMPLFLLVWAIYMLYIKQIKFKELILLGIPIFTFAVPLIYFLLLNFGIVKANQIGIFTLPILPEFRSGEIGITNIWKTGAESIKTIFTAEGTIYLMYIPLFLIGYIMEFSRMVKEIKEKKHGISSLMIIAFTTMFVGLLFTRIPTPNKANVLYIPMLYFVAIAILEICNNSKVLLAVFIVLITVSVVNYAYYYYKYDGIYTASWYEDAYLKDVTEKLESDEETRDKEKYILAYKSSAYIYNMIALRPSPEEFVSTQRTKLYNNGSIIPLTCKILEYNYLYAEKELLNLDLENEDCVFVIVNKYGDAINYLKQNGFSSETCGIYEILTKQWENWTLAKAKLPTSNFLVVLYINFK